MGAIGMEDGRRTTIRRRRGGALALGALVLLVLATPALADPPARLHARTPTPLLTARTPSLLTARTPSLLTSDPPSAVRQPPSANPHGDISIPCSACHTEQGWTPLRSPLQFDHSEQTRFVMTGQHAVAECASCHLDLRFDEPKGTADECASCHVDVHRGQLGDDCLACHTTTDFNLTNGELIHARTTFPLTGAHLLTTCESCHTGDADGLFAPLDTDCFACHQADYQRTESPPHAAAGFSTDCASCHNTLTFSGGPFDHVAASGGFALLGAHAALECASCHAVPGFEPLFDAAGDADCYACHQADYERAEAIDHDAFGFPTDCAQCHNTTTWDGARFDHIAVSGGFALVGAHEALACASCHTGPGGAIPFDPAGQNDCFACHASDHAEEHPAFPTDCLQCHSVNTWDGASFDHLAVSGGFGLIGAHSSLPCSSCHVGPDYDPIFEPSGQNDCVACHQPEHGEVHPSFPTDCLQCHNMNTWDDPTFEHEAVSGGFALVGAHATLECSACHAIPGYEPLFEASDDTDCYACHAEEHEDEHPGFPTDCLQCHTTTTWDDADFDHAAASGGFTLVGAHDALPCASCHAGPDFDPIFDASGQDDCFACHAEDAQQAHPGFPTDCVQCHNVSAWDGATFDHASVADGFALVGAHDALECASCHTLPDFGSIFDPTDQNDCYACHAQEAEQAHVDFPRECLQCHNVNSWEGATFDHATIADGFALVGAHATLPCSTCHTIPDFDVIFDPTSQNDCIACHQPEHQAAHPSFPTNCLQCHTTDTWDGAEFDHDPYFPIYSGKHRGTWDSCQTCHNQPGTFAVFTCLVCHEHRRSEMDDEHEDVNGYVYESTACLNCHPDGED